MLAFLGAIGLFAPLALAACARRLHALIRPLAILGAAASLYTATVGIARLADWDAALTYAQMLSSGTRSHADVIAAVVIPIWPHAAALLGLALAVAYLLVAVWKRRFVTLMTPKRPTPNQLAEQRARVARFDE